MSGNIQDYMKFYEDNSNFLVSTGTEFFVFYIHTYFAALGKVFDVVIVWIRFESREKFKKNANSQFCVTG